MPDEGSRCASRFVLWVDAVGGFLVCEDDVVTVGQAVPGNPVHIPLLADISRHHATFHRDEEGYVIEAVRPSQVDGRALDHLTWLADGSVIEMGSSVQFMFRRPHPLSTSARLDCISHHQTVPSTSGVLLMSQNLVLGPASTSHVACPNWKDDVLLFRERGRLFCRTSGNMKVDGKIHERLAEIRAGSCVEGSRFAFSIERI